MSRFDRMEADEVRREAECLEGENDALAQRIKHLEQSLASARLETEASRADVHELRADIRAGRLYDGLAGLERLHPGPLRGLADDLMRALRPLAMDHLAQIFGERVLGRSQ